MSLFRFINLLDKDLAQMNEVRGKQLCKGESPKLMQGIKYMLTIRIV